MNTTGFIRGYMAKNMNAEEFIQVDFRALSRENMKEKKITLKTTNNNNKKKRENYKLNLDKKLVKNTKAHMVSIDIFWMNLRSKDTTWISTEVSMSSTASIFITAQQ